MIPSALDSPLTDKEIEELHHFLVHEAKSDDALTLDMLDGFLHALVVGPTTIMPRQWLPVALGGLEWFSALPNKKANHVLNLIMRRHNDIVRDFGGDELEMYPLWAAEEYRGKIYKLGMGWAMGFLRGVQLCLNDWLPLLESEQGKAWFRPINLLGTENFSADQDALTSSPSKRAKLTDQIPAGVLDMYEYWLPYREAVYERETAQRMKPKVGRNEPCPCGSEKKFKKCCGAANDLH